MPRRPRDAARHRNQGAGSKEDYPWRSDLKLRWSFTWISASAATLAPLRARTSGPTARAPSTCTRPQGHRVHVLEQRGDQAGYGIPDTLGGPDQIPRRLGGRREEAKEAAAAPAGQMGNAEQHLL